MLILPKSSLVQKYSLPTAYTIPKWVTFGNIATAMLAQLPL